MRIQLLPSLALITCLLIVSCEIKNQPRWIEQGPFYLTDTAVEGIPGEPSSGAINCVLPHPENKEIIYVGTVNGGIWKTENAYDSSPHWEPLTDHLPSLSISHMVFDPLDSTYHTIYAGTGRLSSGIPRGGPEVGIYVTSDAGTTWNILGNAEFKDKTIYKLLALPTNPSNDKLPNLFVATDDGLYRSHSVDSFDAVLGGDIVDLTYDPENLTNIFAAQLDSGIVYSSNSGDSLSWNMLPVKGLDSLKQNNLKLDFANKELYVAESRTLNSNVWIFSAPAPYDEFLTLNSPTTLEGAIAGIGGEQLGPFPGHQSYKHFSFLVNVENGRTVIYQGGDRNKKLRTLLFSSTGQGKSSGRIFRGVRNGRFVDWLPVVGAATHGTAPHADSRHLVFDAADNLLEADDGGIYRLTGNTNSYKWQSIIGDLRITELYSVAWDSRTQSIVAGAQDVGSLEQITPALSEDSIKRWKAARLYSILGKDLGDLIGSTSNLESDGGIVAVANQDSFSIRYGMGNGLQTFVSRKYWNEIDPINVGSNFYLFNYGCLGLFCALHPADTINTEGFRLIRYEVNRADPTRFVIGGRATYEFFNDGTEMDVIDTSRLGLNAASIAYGAPDHPDLLYVAKDNEISQRHTPNTHWIRKDFNPPNNKTIIDIAIDPGIPDNLYFITKNRVLRFNDFSSGDASIDTLTGNLPTAFQDYDLDLYTLVVFKVNIKDQERKVLLVGGYGGVFYTIPREDGAINQLWLKYGEGLPNVIITDLHYNAKDDVLIAGSWGRGAWMIPDVSINLPEVVID